jgi:hypothetical protein
VQFIPKLSDIKVNFLAAIIAHVTAFCFYKLTELAACIVDWSAAIEYKCTEAAELEAAELVDCRR